MPKKGYKQTEEHIRKASEAQKGRKRLEHSIRMSGKNNPFYNKKHNDETKIKMAKAKTTHGLSKTKAYLNARNTKYKSSKRNQIPTDVNMTKILEIYSICSLMNEISTNIKWHVDHIIPLSKGGLHHQDNLQILTAEANRKKGAKII